MIRELLKFIKYAGEVSFEQGPQTQLADFNWLRHLLTSLMASFSISDGYAYLRISMQAVYLCQNTHMLKSLESNLPTENQPLVFFPTPFSIFLCYMDSGTSDKSGRTFHPRCKIRLLQRWRSLVHFRQDQ